MRKKSDTQPAVARARSGAEGKRRARGAAARQANDGGRAVPGKVSRGPFHFVQAGGFSGLGRIILDKLDRGVVLLDARGRVLDANSLAVRLLEAGDGMALRSGRFVFAAAGLDARLSRLLDRRNSVAADRNLALAARVRRSNGASYRVVITPVPRDADERHVAFVALIYAPDEQRDISTDVLRELYALTPAQAQVARSLFAGRSVEESAAALNLSLNTVRTHLKQIFTRCEVQSQAELLHLLAQGPQHL
jgi:DNA-binding CsgD family transcriptional regulator